MTTNHQNHNQITNPNPQPYHHSTPTTGKRKRKTTLQNHNQITNPQPHHHQQSEKEKEKQPSRKTHRSETHSKLLADDPCQSTLNVDAHAGQIQNAKSITHTTTAKSTIKSQTKKKKKKKRNHCDRDRLALMLQLGFRRRGRQNVK